MRILVAVIIAACAILPAYAGHNYCGGNSANGRWVTTTVTSWVPEYTYYWQEQVGWHYDQYGNQYPIYRTFWRVIPGHYETRTYQRWVWY